jgi:hypothetical protein
MDGQFAKVLVREFARAAPADPRIELEGLLAVAVVLLHDERSIRLPRERPDIDQRLARIEEREAVDFPYPAVGVDEIDARRMIEIADASRMRFMNSPRSRAMG